MNSMCRASVPTHLTRSCCEDWHGFFHGSVRWGGGETWEEEEEKERNYNLNADAFSFWEVSLSGRRKKKTSTSHKKKKDEEYNGVFCACVSVYNWCKGIRGPVCSNYSCKSSPCMLYAISPGCIFQFCSAITSSVSVEVCMRMSARVIEPYREDKQSLPALLITSTLTTPSYKLCVGVWESRRRVGTEL